MSRIAFFHPSFDSYGGAELLCLAEAHALSTLGDEVSILTFSLDAERWRERFGALRSDVVKKRNWRDLAYGLGRSARMRARAGRAARHIAGADVVLAHNHPCNAMLGAMPFGGRKVWQCNEPPRALHRRDANPRLVAHVEASPEDSSLVACEWRAKLAEEAENASRAEKVRERAEHDVAMTRRLDHVYAISEFARDNARRIYGRCGEEVVYPIVRFPAPGSVTRAANGEGDALQFLVHTRLELEKNVDAVLRGFAQFARRRNGAVLHVVGDGRARGRLEDVARECLPSSAYVFHGYLAEEQLAAVYARCRALVLLTLDESFGMVFPEAAARGLLLIGPDHGGPFEILDGGRLGWCVDPFDPEALVAALEEASALGPAEVERRCRETDAACRARFSAPTIAPKLRRVLLNGD